MKKSRRWLKNSRDWKLRLRKCQASKVHLMRNWNQVLMLFYKISEFLLILRASLTNYLNWRRKRAIFKLSRNSRKIKQLSKSIIIIKDSSHQPSKGAVLPNLANQEMKVQSKQIWVMIIDVDNIIQVSQIINWKFKLTWDLTKDQDYKIMALLAISTRLKKITHPTRKLWEIKTHLVYLITKVQVISNQLKTLQIRMLNKFCFHT